MNKIRREDKNSTEHNYSNHINVIETDRLKGAPLVVVPLLYYSHTYNTELALIDWSTYKLEIHQSIF